MTGQRCRCVRPAGASTACVLAFKYLKHRIAGVDRDETHKAGAIKTAAPAGVGGNPEPAVKVLYLVQLTFHLCIHCLVIEFLGWYQNKRQSPFSQEQSREAETVTV